MKTKVKLQRIRERIRAAGLQALLVPNSDPHGSEYVPAHWNRRQFATGFTGSVGEACFTASSAALWVDSRYFLQAERELAGSGIKLQKIGLPGTPTIAEWLAKQFPRGAKVGVDSQVITRDHFLHLQDEFARAGLSLVGLQRNPVDEAWDNRPELSLSPLIVHELTYAGESVASKLQSVRKAMKAHGATVHVLTELDAIAWLFNLRGADVEFNPVFVAYAIVRETTAHLYVDLRKVTPAVRRHLGKKVRVHRYDAFANEMKKLAKGRGKAWIHSGTASQWAFSLLGKAQLVTERSPITLLKACKTYRQIRGMQSAHVRDGVAMVKFLSWLDENMGKVPMSELSLEVELERARSASKMYRGPSFSPIIGYAANGAVIHYRAVSATDRQIKPRGLMVIDSGGQYPDGTTDITRTVCCGSPTRKQKEHFTRVLKGHIAVATCSFRKGTRGPQLEVLAKQFLWEAGLDYMHGTGHGVGHYLCVHEGPASIAPRFPNEPLQPGMVLSNEPGFYLDGEYGIRIENLVYVYEHPEFRGFYRFGNLTLCPIDRRLIDVSMLTSAERAYLNGYHATVRRVLLPKVKGKAAVWLKRMTAAL
ncbi:MAG: aminopeptidase P family protein [Calditrichaeota bacterium]|nr:aminopeptidase P family protein [Calditrichota bacterium]MCB9391087.1 aminopeptidase P family protein [Calditrichota bacterium]